MKKTGNRENLKIHKSRKSQQLWPPINVKANKKKRAQKFDSRGYGNNVNNNKKESGVEWEWTKGGQKFERSRLRMERWELGCVVAVLSNSKNCHSHNEFMSPKQFR